MGCDAGSCISDISLGSGPSETAFDCLIDTGNDLSQSIMDDSVDKWCKRLQACVNEKGHFEYCSNILG